LRPNDKAPTKGSDPRGANPRATADAGVRPQSSAALSGGAEGGVRPRVGIIGAGPAGLTAAYVLAKQGVPVTVLEADPEYVGGIARTARYKGYHFDIGGHRFFSKAKEVEDLWTEILPNDMLVRPRSSRIFYKGKFFAYPLKAVEALLKLGVVESMRCVLSYGHARMFPVKNPRSLEEWVTNQFGQRLYSIFFKTYTEKVWGMSCKEISADWAAQRIKGLSLTTAVWNALFPQREPKDRRNVVKSLIDTFRYPRRGPGMMWETCAARVKEMGGEIVMGANVTGARLDRTTGRWTIMYEAGRAGRAGRAGGASRAGEVGEAGRLDVDHVISSAPIRQLVAGLEPPMSEASRSAAAALRYRDFLTVVLILKDRGVVSDNWIYVHDPGVRVGRVQNFKSWSPEMVPDPGMACYGLEYFCFENDDVWNASDAELIDLGRRELATIGLAKPEDVVDGCVVRQRKAYPVYDDDYARNVDTIRAELARAYPRLHLVGRNGMHKYNNQDHAMMTALLTARNILAGESLYDVWQVNQDAEYHEAGAAGEQIGASGLRIVPTRLR
jgi:protoporphyrinogen oxidase